MATNYIQVILASLFGKIGNKLVPYFFISMSSTSPLTSPNFRWLWTGQAISTFGARFTVIAIPLLVYDLTNSPFQLGLAFVVQTLAILMFGLWAGALSDRWNRQVTMISADIIRALLILAIPTILRLNTDANITVPLVYLTSFLITAVTQFYTPAKISTIPQTVSKSQLLAANSLDQATIRVAEVVGYAAAGLLIASVGVQLAFFIDAATFLLSAACISLLRLKKTKSDVTKQTSLTRSIREGFDIIGRSTVLRATVIYSAIAPIGIGAVFPLLVIYARDIIKVGDAGYGFLQSAISFGVAIGITVIGFFFSSIPRGRLLSYGTTIFGLFHLLGVLVPISLMRLYDLQEVAVLAITIPFFIILAIANGAIFLGIRTIIQENTPSAAMGRVFNVLQVVSNVAFAIGMASSGLVEYLGATLLIVLWMCFMTTVGVAGILWKDLR